MTIVARLSSHPSDATAAVLADREVSYGEFLADIGRAAGYLRSEGVGPGATVGIHFGPFRDGDDYASFVTHLAAIRLGATHASVHDALSLRQLLECADIKLLVGRKPDGFSGEIKVIPLDLKSLPASDETIDDEAQAIRLNLTSGTTGRPKVVRWDSAMIEARIGQLADLNLISAGTCLDSYLSPRTTAGFRYPVATWWAGGSMLLSGGGTGRNDKAGRSTLCVCSPFQLQRLWARRFAWPHRGKRTIVTLGGKVPPQLRDWALANLANKVIVSYGSTEAGSIAFGDAMASDRHPGAVGWIRDGAEVQVVGPDGRPVAAGKAGKIRLRTKLMVRADGSETSDDEWFEPGDFGTIFEDGLLAIGGRLTDVLNVGGMKLNSTDLEAKLVALDGIEDATTGVVPMANGDTLWIAVVTRDGRKAADVLEQVRPLIARGVPFRLVAVPAIPRNAMGKVDRQRLAEGARHLIRAAQQRKPEHA